MSTANRTTLATLFKPEARTTSQLIRAMATLLTRPGGYRILGGGCGFSNYSLSCRGCEVSRRKEVLHVYTYRIVRIISPWAIFLTSALNRGVGL